MSKADKERLKKEEQERKAQEEGKRHTDIQRVTEMLYHDLKIIPNKLTTCTLSLKNFPSLQGRAGV